MKPAGGCGLVRLAAELRERRHRVGLERSPDPGIERLVADADGTVDCHKANRARVLADLAPYDVLEVRMRNTCCLISTIGLRDPRVLVMGGTFFALPCGAQLVGSILGGSAVKLGWIGRGFCLELLQDGHRVVTTRVRGIRVIAFTEPLH